MFFLQSGAIANELDFVHHGLRSQLDEIKRKELSRLRRSATRQFEMEKGLDPDHLKIPEHVDHENQETFEVVDLKQLILKVFFKFYTKLKLLHSSLFHF